jgi:hypothetical protein
MKNILISFLSLFIIFNIWSCDNFKDKKLSNKELLEMAEKCNKAGKTYFQELQTTMNTPGINYSWDEPEYHYSKRLNACLAHVRYMEFIDLNSGYSQHYNQTVDVFSNKTILRGWFARHTKENKEEIIDLQDGIPNYTSTEYFKRKDKLFSE